MGSQVIIAVIIFAVVIAVDAYVINKLTSRTFGGYLVIVEDPEEGSPYVFFEFKIKPDELKNNEQVVVQIRRKSIS